MNAGQLPEQREQLEQMQREFELQRPRLRGLAYRMLGSVSEAEDVVQDAFVRVSALDLSHVLDFAGYLHTTVARLCLDRLKSARARREVYVGTWLPEPVVGDAHPPSPDAALEQADDLSFALLMTLERLTPPERTAFLLHDVFGQDFAAVAQVLSRSEAACRKLAERARAQVHERQGASPRFAPSLQEEQRLGDAFLRAATSGDIDALKRILAEDAVLYSDGGGKRHAALNPIYGAERIARFFAGIIRKTSYVVPVRVEPRRVNQLPGCVVTYSNGDVAVSALEIKAGRITEIYIISNPDKLGHLRS